MCTENSFSFSWRRKEDELPPEPHKVKKKVSRKPIFNVLKAQTN
jgi:hypothetical protein